MSYTGIKNHNIVKDDLYLYSLAKICVSYEFLCLLIYCVDMQITKKLVSDVLDNTVIKITRNCSGNPIIFNGTLTQAELVNALL